MRTLINLNTPFGFEGMQQPLTLGTVAGLSLAVNNVPDTSPANNLVKFSAFLPFIDHGLDPTLTAFFGRL